MVDDAPTGRHRRQHGGRVDGDSEADGGSGTQAEQSGDHADHCRQEDSPGEQGLGGLRCEESVAERH